VGIFVEQRGEPLAGGSLAGHDDGMSQARAQVPSYESGVSDLPLLGETIGQNLRRNGRMPSSRRECPKSPRPPR
jgi:hypothetical protein